MSDVALKEKKKMDFKKPKKKGLGRLLEITGQRKITMIFSSFFAVLSAAMALVPFVIIYLISIAMLDPPIQRDYVWKLVWLASGAVVLRFVFMYISAFLSHVAAFDILYGIRKQLTQHLAILPMGYFTNRTSGGIKKILNEDVEDIELFIGHHFPDLSAAIALPVMTLVYLFVTDWRLALVTIIPLPFAFVAQLATFSDRDKLMRQYHAALEKMNGIIVEYVRGMPVVKVFNQQVESFTRLKESVYAYRDFVNMWGRKSTPSWAAFTVIINTSLFFILPAGVWFYVKGTLEISTLLLFLLIGVGYTAPLMRVAHYGGLLRKINDGVKNIDAIFSQPVCDTSDKPEVPVTHDIELRDVNFSYGEKQVLKSVSFTTRENTITALVGPSGAGKSTIAHLILRLWDIKEGEILIGGMNINNIPLNELMNKIAFVFQDSFIFNDTVYENIRMGRKGATAKQVTEAAKAAQAHDFITSLPKGYWTVIGNGGTCLSGGECQRISIARAILKDAPIIILDEAISFADPENGSRIQNALSTLIAGKVVIVIAHRLSTITDVDQIVLLDQGTGMGKGTHGELLKTQSLYKRMWESHISAQDWEFIHEEGSE
jgi:ATP-binding cassette subfamily B protein